MVVCFFFVIFCPVGGKISAYWLFFWVMVEMEPGGVLLNRSLSFYYLCQGGGLQIIDTFLLRW